MRFGDIDCSILHAAWTDDQVLLALTSVVGVHIAVTFGIDNSARASSHRLFNPHDCRILCDKMTKRFWFGTSTVQTLRALACCIEASPNASDFGSSIDKILTVITFCFLAFSNSFGFGTSIVQV